MRDSKHVGLVVLMAIASAFAVARAESSAEEARQWYKGNTHTHTWWSDGDSPPELVVKWYKENGYHFLALSDHNILSEGEKWIVPGKRRETAAANYENAFSDDWIEKRQREGKTEYRLKPLNEFRARFEETGRFLLIQAEEISDAFEGKPIHVNGVNLKEVIPPPHGSTLRETLQNNIDVVLAQRERTGRPMLPHVNHPNFGWALAPEDLMELRGEQFFEVFNGHPGVRNPGDGEHVSTERMWDIILTCRLAKLNLPVMYGVATDDAHTYTAWNGGVANPGRGWVMVRARYLTPEHIVLAMERGDFYASTGVVLDDVTFKGNTLDVRIASRPGVSYTTQFIGTLKDQADMSPDAGGDSGAGSRVRYSEDIGRVLDEQTGTRASYRLTGDEVYVRARVISTAPHPNAIKGSEFEVAWVQPVQPQGR